MTAMNPHATITRDEFDRTIEELRAEMKANSSSSTAAGGASLERPREEFVRKDEFRLIKWFGGLALAAILSGMGLLYQGLAEQRVAMERQFADLRAEMNAGFRAITVNVDSRITALQDHWDARFTALQRHGDARSTALQRHGDARSTALQNHGDAKFTALQDHGDARFTALQRDVADVRERLARVETLLDVKNREIPPD